MQSCRIDSRSCWDSGLANIDAFSVRVLRRDSVSTLCVVCMVEGLPVSDRLPVTPIGVDWEWVWVRGWEGGWRLRVIRLGVFIGGVEISLGWNDVCDEEEWEDDEHERDGV